MRNLKLVLTFVACISMTAQAFDQRQKPEDDDDVLLRRLCVRPGVTANQAFDCAKTGGDVSDKVHHDLIAIALQICAPKNVSNKECFLEAIKFFQERKESGAWLKTWLSKGLKYCDEKDKDRTEKGGAKYSECLKYALQTAGYYRNANPAAAGQGMPDPFPIAGSDGLKERD